MEKKRIRRWLVLGCLILSFYLMPNFTGDATAQVSIDATTIISSINCLNPFSQLFNTGLRTLMNTSGVGVGGCDPHGVTNIFSSFVCTYENIVSEVLTKVYCGVQAALIQPLTALLTLFVVIFGAAFTIGVVPFTAKETVFALFKFGAVWMFATNADYTIGILYQGLMGFVQQSTVVVMNALSNAGAAPFDSISGPRGVLAWMDELVVQFINVNVAGTFNCDKSLIGFVLALLAVVPSIALFAISMAIQLLMTLFRAIVGYLVAITGIMFLLTMSPIFLGFALFKITQTYFSKWVKYLTSFALQVFIVFAMIGIVLSLDIGDDMRSLFELVQPYEKVKWVDGVRTPFKQCSICEIEFESGKEFLSPGKAPGVKCSGGTAPMDPHSLTANSEFLEFVIIVLAKIFILAFLVEAGLKAAPQVAQALSAVPYAPALGDLGGSGHMGGVSGAFHKAYEKTPGSTPSKLVAGAAAAGKAAKDKLTGGASPATGAAAGGAAESASAGISRGSDGGAALARAETARGQNIEAAITGLPGLQGTAGATRTAALGAGAISPVATRRGIATSGEALAPSRQAGAGGSVGSGSSGVGGAGTFQGGVQNTITNQTAAGALAEFRSSERAESGLADFRAESRSGDASGASSGVTGSAGTSRGPGASGREEGAPGDFVAEAQSGGGAVGSGGASAGLGASGREESALGDFVAESRPVAQSGNTGPQKQKIQAGTDTAALQDNLQESIRQLDAQKTVVEQQLAQSGSDPERQKRLKETLAGIEQNRLQAEKQLQVAQSGDSSGKGGGTAASGDQGKVILAREQMQAAGQLQARRERMQEHLKQKLGSEVSGIRNLAQANKEAIFGKELDINDTTADPLGQMVQGYRDKFAELREIYTQVRENPPEFDVYGEKPAITDSVEVVRGVGGKRYAKYSHSTAVDVDTGEMLNIDDLPDDVKIALG